MLQAVLEQCRRLVEMSALELGLTEQRGGLLVGIVRQLQRPFEIAGAACM
jgi:hypothetical protein